jgi:hypothetical protein
LDEWELKFEAGRCDGCTDNPAELGNDHLFRFIYRVGGIEDKQADDKDGDDNESF